MKSKSLLTVLCVNMSKISRPDVAATMSQHCGHLVSGEKRIRTVDPLLAKQVL